MQILFIGTIILTFIVCIFLGYAIKNKFTFKSKKVNLFVRLYFVISILYLIYNILFLVRMNRLILLIYIASIIILVFISYYTFVEKDIFLTFLLTLLFGIFLFAILFINLKTDEPSICKEEVLLNKVENNSNSQIVTIELNQLDGKIKTYTVMEYNNDSVYLPLEISTWDIASYEVIEKGEEKIVKNTKTEKFYYMLSYFDFIEPKEKTEISYTVYIKAENLRYR